MSKLHKPRGPVGADTGAGELRKPHDYANQPEQGGAYTARETADGGDERPAARDPGGTPPEGGESSREYGHGSGDRNTMHDEHGGQGFAGGKQRDATPGAGAHAKAQRGDRDASPSGGGNS